MRDILGADFYTYQGFFEKASEIAMYYGFRPIETPMLERENVFTSGVGKETDIVEKEMYTLRVRGGEKLALRPEGTASIMRAYIEGGMHTMPQPVMLYYYGPFFRHDKPQRGRYREFFQFGLEVLGTSKSIADAMVIQIMTTILKEAGFKNLCVLVNSIGDKTCRPHYIRELVSYYRKNMGDLCGNCRQRLKGNPLRLLDCKELQCVALKENAPQSVAHLCEHCKEHFREVLECLDTIKVPYSIDHTLVRGLDYYSRTVFEIIDDEDLICIGPRDEQKKPAKENKEKDGDVEGAPEERALPLALGGGGRYDYLAKQLGSKKEISAVGGSIGVDRVVEAPQLVSLTPRIIKKPKIYFIQIGFEAKLKSLTVIEVLRKARIPLVHALSKDKLSIQLAIAEKYGIPYVVILGQKEALEESVIVRDMSNRSQDTVKIEKLEDYLKKKKV